MTAVTARRYQAKYSGTVTDNQERASPSTSRADAAPTATLRHLAIIIVCGLLVRMLFHLAYKPWWARDSAGYTGPWLNWTEHYFSDGSRTPLYPIFLGLCQWMAHRPAAELLNPFTANLVTWAQSILGLLSACLLYLTMLELRIRPRVAVVAAGAFACIAGVALFEMLVLSVALSLAGVTAFTWLFVRTARRAADGKPCTLSALTCGLAGSLAALVRPDNLVFVLIAILSLAVLSVRLRFSSSEKSAPKLLLPAAWMAVSLTPLLLLWMTINFVGTGYFRITSLRDVVSTESVYNLYDRVPPEDHVLGEILQRSYRQTNHDGQIYRHHIWFALPEILHRGLEFPLKPMVEEYLHRNAVERWLWSQAADERRLGPSGPIINRYIATVTSKLRRTYPGAWLGNATDNFFRDTFRFQYDTATPEETDDPRAVEGGSVVRSRTLWKLACTLIATEAPLLAALYILVLGYVVFCPLTLLTAPARPLEDSITTTLALAVLGTFVAACLLAAYYPQHGEPYLGVMVIASAYLYEQRARLRDSVQSVPAPPSGTGS